MSYNQKKVSAWLRSFTVVSSIFFLKVSHVFSLSARCWVGGNRELLSLIPLLLLPLLPLLLLPLLPLLPGLPLLQNLPSLFITTLDLWLPACWQPFYSYNLGLGAPVHSLNLILYTVYCTIHYGSTRSCSRSRHNGCGAPSAGA